MTLFLQRLRLTVCQLQLTMAPLIISCRLYHEPPDYVFSYGRFMYQRPHVPAQVSISLSLYECWNGKDAFTNRRLQHFYLSAVSGKGFLCSQTSVHESSVDSHLSVGILYMLRLMHQQFNRLLMSLNIKTVSLEILSPVHLPPSFD